MAARQIRRELDLGRRENMVETATMAALRRCDALWSRREAGCGRPNRRR